MSRMQAETTLSISEVFAGVDIGKRYLDVFIHPTRQRARFKNDKAGIRDLIQLCERTDVRSLTLEATGRYHRHLHRRLHDAGLAVAVVNRFGSRKFGNALGQVAKTDRIDAEVLAAFGAMIRPEPSPPPTHDFVKLQDLLSFVDAQPTRGLFDLATAMFRHAWDSRRAQAEAIKQSAKAQIRDIGKQVEALLMRIMSTTNDRVVAAYEDKIANLERNKALLRQQMAKQVELEGAFDEKLELSLKFLASP